MQSEIAAQKVEEEDAANKTVQEAIAAAQQLEGPPNRIGQQGNQAALGGSSDRGADGLPEALRLDTPAPAVDSTDERDAEPWRSENGSTAGPSTGDAEPAAAVSGDGVGQTERQE